MNQEFIDTLAVQSDGIWAFSCYCEEFGLKNGVNNVFLNQFGVPGAFWDFDYARFLLFSLATSVLEENAAMLFYCEAPEMCFGLWNVGCLYIGAGVRR